MAPILVARAMNISNRYLSKAYFNHSPLSRDILHLPVFSMLPGSRYYDATTVEQMSMCGWNCCEELVQFLLAIITVY